MLYNIPMKKVSVALIILSFLVFAGFECQKTPEYEVLEVIDVDKIVLDLNFNRIKDMDEIFQIDGIEVISPEISQKNLKNLDITEFEAKCIQNAAKKFTISKLLGRKIRLKENSNCTLNLKNEKTDNNQAFCLGRVELDGVDFAETLIKEGFAFSKDEKDKKDFIRYKILENPRAIKKNAKLCGTARRKINDPDFLKSEENQYSHRRVNAPTAVFRESPVLEIGDVTIFLNNPNEFKTPSNKVRTRAGKVLSKNIDEAKTSIDFALYGLDRQDEILAALSRAQKRGVKIRGVVDTKADGTYVYADTRKLAQYYNVVPDLKSSNMHNKFFIFDDDKIFTGTMNLSTTGTGGYNANTAVLIKNASVVSAFKSEFEGMYEGKFQGIRRDFTVRGINLGAAGELDIYFSPVGNPLEEGILPLLNSAEKEIYVSIFYLTNRKIIDALINAKARGADVRIIYDAVGANNMKGLVALMRSKGLKLKVENWGGKNHEKNIVIDGKIFITGSANFSNSGMYKNDENVLIFKSPPIARFYRDYFLKLYNGLDEKYLKFTPRAESFESGNSCYDGLDNNFDGKVDKDDEGCKK